MLSFMAQQANLSKTGKFYSQSEKAMLPTTSSELMFRLLPFLLAYSGIFLP